MDVYDCFSAFYPIETCALCDYMRVYYFKIKFTFAPICERIPTQFVKTLLGVWRATYRLAPMACKISKDRKFRFENYFSHFSLVLREGTICQPTSCNAHHMHKVGPHWSEISVKNWFKSILVIYSNIFQILLHEAVLFTDIFKMWHLNC